MAKQLLDAVNEVLKRANIIAGNAGLLTSLTNSSFQHNIDVAVQVINEGLDEIYTSSSKDFEGQMKESTITLATGQREYSLAADLVTLTWPLVDRTNTQYIERWKGSYNDFLLYDPQQNYTGLPFLGMISPITGFLRVERAPDAPSNGKIYTYEYDRDMALVNATDLFSFNNEVFRSLVPAWVQLYNRGMRQEFDQALYTQAMGRACRALTEGKPDTDYDPRGSLSGYGGFDVFSY